VHPTVSATATAPAPIAPTATRRRTVAGVSGIRVGLRAGAGADARFSRCGGSLLRRRVLMKETVSRHAGCYRLRPAVFRRLWEKIKLLWKLAKSERATPPEIGWAVGIGAFVGGSPAFGVRPWLALAVATLAKKNRLFAWLGSHTTSNWVLSPFIILAEVQVAHRLRTGSFVVLDSHNVIDQAPHLLLDWCLGWLLIGGAIGIAVGFTAYAFAHRRDRRKRVAQEKADAIADVNDAKVDAVDATPAPPVEARPPSSGSPA
jgi:hypothetical protein